MEECFGTLCTLEACYDKMFDLKVITPEQILNYTNYLIEKHYWEKAFRIFERGVAILRWPHVSSIWITYLATFVSRYGGRKIERARELFEQVDLVANEKII
jgi:pre-mRNA-splicing factor SYF1